MAVITFHSLLGAVRVSAEYDFALVSTGVFYCFARTYCHSSADKRESYEQTNYQSCNLHYISPPFIKNLRLLRVCYKIRAIWFEYNL